MTLTGQCAIITGASQGFGFAIAKQFILAGADVMLCARDSELLYRAQQTLIATTQTKTRVMAIPTDVSHPQQMHDLVTKTLDEIGKINILVANAGIYGVKGLIEEVDWEEWSQAIDINLKGTVIQCRAVLPHLKKNKCGKIIIISGGGATKPMPHLSAYATSKAAIVRFAETLAEEVRDFYIDVNTVAPGALNTRFLDEILAAGPEKVGNLFYERALKQKQEGGASLEIGAALCTFLASADSNGITGKLISALWDPWLKFPEYLDTLKQSDIYTLRRILPKDRDQPWGDEN